MKKEKKRTWRIFPFINLLLTISTTSLCVRWSSSGWENIVRYILPIVMVVVLLFSLKHWVTGEYDKGKREQQ